MGVRSDLRISLLAITPREILTYVHKKTFTRILIKMLIVKEKSEKESQ